MKTKTTSRIFIPLVALSISCLPTLSHASWWDQIIEVFTEVEEKVVAPDNKTLSTLPTSLSIDDMQKAFKEALSMGSESVVNQLSLKDGFNSDPKIHIPLPDSLKTVQSTLDKFAMAGLMDDLETKLNRAAEAATPEAKALLLNAIKEMTFDDVKKIYDGPQDSATQYLKSKTSPALKTKMMPIIEKALNEVGAIVAYDKAISEYKDLPFVPDVKANLLDHVLQESMNGMFLYLAEEEVNIRKDPVKQSTELLKKVFGQ